MTRNHYNIIISTCKRTDRWTNYEKKNYSLCGLAQDGRAETDQRRTVPISYGGSLQFDGLRRA
jgi:hypothetical protein